MPSKYSFNQKGAIVTMFLVAVWALLSIIIAIDMGLQSAFALIIFGVMSIIAWVILSRNLDWILTPVVITIPTNPLF